LLPLVEQYFELAQVAFPRVDGLGTDYDGLLGQEVTP
jgi:hypothetical protein